MATKSTGCMVTLAVVGVVAIAGVVGVSWFFKKAANVVEDIATGVGVSEEVQEDIASLNDDYEFDRPEDNRISEGRLRTYISIKEGIAGRIEQYKQRFEEIEQRTKDGSGWDEVADAYKALGDIRTDFLKSLRNHKMSPKEYGFLTEQVYQTYFVSAATQAADQYSSAISSAKPQVAAQMEQLKAQLQNQALSDEQRKSLKQGIENYKAAMQQAQQGVAEMQQKYEDLPQENRELLDKYRDQLEVLKTAGWEFWGLVLSGGGQ